MNEKHGVEEMSNITKQALRMKGGDDHKLEAPREVHNSGHKNMMVK